LGIFARLAFRTSALGYPCLLSGCAIIFFLCITSKPLFGDLFKTGIQDQCSRVPLPSIWLCHNPFLVDYLGTWVWDSVNTGMQGTSALGYPCRLSGCAIILFFALHRGLCLGILSRLACKASALGYPCLLFWLCHNPFLVHYLEAFVWGSFKTGMQDQCSRIPLPSLWLRHNPFLVHYIDAFVWGSFQDWHAGPVL
jgi:hypothetical protein